jgi:hypothetical protein
MKKLLILYTLVFTLGIIEIQNTIFEGIEGSSVYGQIWVIQQITNNDYDDDRPDISGNKIVWDGDVQGNGNFADREIFFYDGTNITRITNNSYHDWNPEISESNVAWSGYIPSLSLNGIYFYDGENTSLIGVDAQPYPQISGDNVTWSAYVSGDISQGHLEIFFFDGSSTTQLTYTSYDEEYPRISGNNIVWHRRESLPQDTEIFLYDGFSIQQITDNSFNEQMPDVSGNNVTWEGKVGDSYETFFYDGTTITQITNDPPHTDNPKISGNNIVWRASDIEEIFFYDGSTVTRLTNDDYWVENPQISGSNVVWNGYDGNDSEIFLYDGITVTQLTNNEYNDYNQSISGNNVTWQGFDGNDYEIFFATLIPSINDIINFIIANADIHGEGPGNSADHRYNAFLNMLLVTADLIEAANYNAACNKLESVFKKCDGLPNPPDFIDGNTDTMATLIEMFDDLMESLGCPLEIPEQYTATLIYYTDGEGKNWIEIELTDEQGNPVANEKFTLYLPDGSVKKGRLDENGEANIESTEPGDATIDFPQLDTNSWQRL